METTATGERQSYIRDTGLGGDWRVDKAAYVHKRKKRYMAQLLEQFERDVEPHIPPEAADQFKGTVRQKLHALALDACEIMSLQPGEELNGAAVELRDQVSLEQRRTA
jgi:hypothetical protein